MATVFVILSDDGGSFSRFQGVSATLEQAQQNVAEGSLSGMDNDVGITATTRLVEIPLVHWESKAVLRQWGVLITRSDDEDEEYGPYNHIQEVDPSVDWWAGRTWSLSGNRG